MMQVSMTDDARRFLDDQAVIRQTASLRLMVRALLRDDAAVDDVVQETWLTAMEHPPREGFDAGGWLRGIARNAIRHLRRSDIRRDRRESHAADRVEPAAGQVVAKIEQLQELLEAVSALREPIRQTVALRYLDGLMPREIADRLSIPVATVKTRLSTGLRQLREALDARHGGDRSAWHALLAPLAPDLARVAVAAASAGAASAGTFAVGGFFMKAASLVAGLVAFVGIVVAVLWPSDPEPAARIETTAGAAPSAGVPVAGTIESPRRLVPKTVVEAALPAADENPSGGSARARGPFERVTLKGRCVAAESGAPLARCRVTLTGHQGTGYDLGFEHLDWRNPDPVTTAEDGVFKFTLGLPQFESTSAGYAPRVHVSVAHPERVDAFGSVDFGEFPRGKTMDLGDVSLAGGAKQQIRVADAEGRPVPGVAVMFVRVAEERIDPFSRPRFASQDGEVARTRLDGTLAFDGRLKPGRWTASLYRQQPDAQVEFVVTPSAELAPQATIVLPSGAPTSRISGRVVDRDHRPVADLAMGAFDTRRIRSRDPNSSMTRTAEDGTFVIRATNEARDATTNVMFTRSSRYDAWSSFGEYAWGENNLQLVLEADATLALSVVDEGGAPVTDFAVRCVPAKDVRSPGTLRLVAHDAGGKLEVRGVAPGTHHLFVFPLASELAPSEWQEIQVPSSGSVEVRVTLERAVERKVRVVRAGGSPVAGTKVELVFGGDAPPAPRAGSPRSASSTRTISPSSPSGSTRASPMLGRSRAQGACVRAEHLDPGARARSPADDPGPDRMERGPRLRSRSGSPQPRSSAAPWGPPKSSTDGTRRSGARLRLSRSITGRGRTPTPGREPRASAPDVRGSSL